MLPDLQHRPTAADVLTGIDLTGKHFIVTGGASGLGAASTRAFLAAGADVTVAVRQPASAANALGQHDRLTVRELDLADLRSVAEFVRSWSGGVDALVLNAGVMALPTLQRAPSGWELQLATNFLGHFALTEGLKSALQAATGRIVSISSGAQLLGGVNLEDLNFERRAYDPWAAYAQSKSATALMVVDIATRWAGTGITANALAPGFIHTGLQRHLSDDVMRAFGAMNETGELVTPPYYKTPEQGAATIALLAASPNVAGVSGKYFEDEREAPTVDGGPGVQNGIARWANDPVTAAALGIRAQATIFGN